MALTFADTHNMIVILTKLNAKEGFEQIINFLNASVIQYALMVNLTIYVSCIKQFWSSVSLKKTNDVVRLQALIDRRKVIITEDTVRQALQLYDADSIDCLPNEEIFFELARMGYEEPSTKLTFYKAFFLAQWKFLIHTILQFMSAKRMAMNEFSSSMASVVICLAIGRKFNFSKYIFDSLVKNVDSSSKFYMYPRFLQLMINAQVGDLSFHTIKYTSPVLTQKVFANMKRVGKGFSGVDTPLFEGMLVPQQVHDDVADDVANVVADADEVGKEEANKQSKRKSETSEERAAKKQKLGKEVEELKTHLQIVPRDEDDVYTEATPLALKVPIVDYQIHTKNNKPYYKIIRADGTQQLFLSFISLLRNFDREDLEMLWKIIQERFASSEPKNFSDDFLLNTLKAMFKKPNVEASIWRNQRGRYGLEKVKSQKLLESCGVYIITFITTQMIVLVERRYALTRFTLDQMLNNVRLKVEEESEVSLKLLRFGLRGSKKLKHGALNLYVGNGMRETVKAIGSFDLILLSGLIIVFDNLRYAPSITRGVVLLSRLVENGYIYKFKNYGVFVSKDDVFYFNVIPRDGIYEIDMHDLVPNRFKMENSKRGNIPMQDKHNLSKSQGASTPEKKYLRYGSYLLGILEMSSELLDILMLDSRPIKTMENPNQDMSSYLMEELWSERVPRKAL
nr:hypothetical protein [Tanacetum cinerariifolium]